MKPRYAFGVIQVLVGILITIFIESVASGNLLFTKGLLAEELRKTIIDHPKTVASILLSIYGISYFIYQKTLTVEKNEIVYSNICRAIFASYIKDDHEIDNTQIRLTVFKAFKGYKFIGKYFFPKNCTYLKQVGRYQTIQDKKNCQIYFLPKEGCVGLCYNLAQVIHQEIDEIGTTESQKIAYYEANKKNFGLNRSKVDQLNETSCSFLAFPINYFNTDDVFGVIIFDSTQRNKIIRFKTREMEDKILDYSVFFNKEKTN